MTREEAIEYFKKCNERIRSIAIDENGMSRSMKETVDANNTAIEALEQQPCEDCIVDTDIKPYDSPTNGSVFLKTYPDSRFSNIAYDDGICYVYVYLGGSRTRFTSDWWNATYKKEA